MTYEVDGVLAPPIVNLSDAAPVGLIALDERRRIIEVNPRGEAILGTSGRRLKSRPLSQFIYHDNQLFDLIDTAHQIHGEVYTQGVELTGPNLLTETLAIRITYDDDLRQFFVAFAPFKKTMLQQESVGLSNFGRILGHEIKNPLGGLSGAAQLLARTARDDQRELLELIRSEADRIRRMVDRVMIFETYAFPQLELINIHAILDAVISLESVAAPGVTLVKAYDPSLPMIEGDPDHLHEAFLNLVKNAVEAAKDAQNPQVIIKTRYEAGVKLGTKARQKLNGALSVSIMDNGEGIAPGVGERIFDPFFTTKHSGTGVGLPLVRDIVLSHGGRVGFDRHKDQTRFEVLLPIPKKKEA